MSFAINTKNLFSPLFIVFIVSLYGCSDDDDQHHNNYQHHNPVSIKFDVQGATKVLAYESSVKLSPASVKLTSYNTNGSDSSATDSPLIIETGEGKLKAGLIITDADGENGIKLAYTVVDPKDRGYIYLGLSWPINSTDTAGKSFTMCSVLKVKLADDSYSCVEENFYLDAYANNGSESYSKGKPIQFDSDGNIYMLGSKYDSSSSFHGHSSHGILYKKDTEGVLKPLTQDDEYIRLFSVLPTGDIAFIPSNIATATATATANLQLLQKSTSSATGYRSMELSQGEPRFFAVDYYNTVIYADLHSTLLHLVSPKTSGGVNRASLDVTPSKGNASLNNIIIDNGAVFGVFDSFGEIFISKILPYQSAERLAAVNLEQHAWNYINMTPPAIINNHIVMVQPYDASGYGNADKIVVTNISTGSSETFLEYSNQTNTSERYTIERWQASGNAVTFVGLDQTNNQPVMGTIEIKQDSEGGYDITKNINTSIGSAVTANMELSDMVIINAPATPEVETSEIVSTSNFYSASLAYLEPQDIANNILTVTPASSNIPVEYLSVWADQQHQHLIFDTSSDGLDDNFTDPLAYATQYTIESTSSDVTAYFIQDSFTTPPERGWIHSPVEGNVSNDIAGGAALTYVDYSDASGGHTFYEYPNVPQNKNITVEFSLYQKWNYDSFNLMLSGGDEYADTLLRIDFDCYLSVRVKETSYWSAYPTPTRIRPSCGDDSYYNTWTRYKVEINDTTLTLSTLNSDGNGYNEIYTTNSFHSASMLQAVEDRTLILVLGNSHHSDLARHSLLQIDNLKISTDAENTTEDFNADLPTITSLDYKNFNE